MNQKQKKTGNQLYRAAVKRGFAGTYEQFCETSNTYLSKMITDNELESAGIYFNDTGRKSKPVTNTTTTSAPLTVSVQEPVLTDKKEEAVTEPVTKQVTQPVAEEPAQASTTSDQVMLKSILDEVRKREEEKKKKAADKIFGMNKWLFGGLVFVAVLLFGATAAFILRKARAFMKSREQKSPALGQTTITAAVSEAEPKTVAAQAGAGTATNEEVK